MKKTKLALVIRTVNYGGAERFLLKLVKYLDKNKFAVDVILLVRDEKHHLWSNFVEAGVKPIPAPYHKNDPRLVLWLRRLWRRFDIVHSFLWRSDATCALVSLLFGFKNHIISERGDRRGGRISKRRIAYDRTITFKEAKWAISNSSYGAKTLVKLGMPLDKISIIPNGIEIEQIKNLVKMGPFVSDLLNISSSIPVIGIVGRLTHTKGHKVLIEAAQILKASFGEFALIIIGDGECRQDLLNYVIELGVREKVFFLGYQENVFSIINRCDICVLTSYDESCPNVILEYMAVGKPIVASRAGGIPEIVIDGKSGLLVPSGNCESLAEALLFLLKNPDKGALMGKFGKKHVADNFSMREVVRKYEIFYSNILRML